MIRLRCPSCGTTIEGHFEGCSFCNLSQDDRRFLHVFLLSRGNLKEVEKQLAISYPTVRSKLDSIINKMGYSLDKKAEKYSEHRKKILEDLKKGQIDIKSAIDRG